jgi:hypothetical protein
MPDLTPDQDTQDATKKSLTNLIASMLIRYRSQKDAPVKEILMLIAALTMLNSPNGSVNYTVATARRLISGTGK